ncbi:MAG: hypothetical protein AAFN70_18095, partial [Planctomycetota bacterium]
RTLPSSYCSKYTAIDRRVFSHISRSLKGVIFRSDETIRDAIARTETRTGLRGYVSDNAKRLRERSARHWSVLLR